MQLNKNILQFKVILSVTNRTLGGVYSTLFLAKSEEKKVFWVPENKTQVQVFENEMLWSLFK